MAGPAITTLLSPNPASGTITTSAIEQTIASASAAPGTYILRIDLHNMQDGDKIMIGGYNSADGANQRPQFSYPKINAQSLTIELSPQIITADYVKFSILRVAGTDRDYAWTVLNLYGV